MRVVSTASLRDLREATIRMHVLTSGHEQNATCSQQATIRMHTGDSLKPYRVGGSLEAGLKCRRAVRLSECAVEDLKPAAANAPSCQYLLVAVPALLFSAICRALLLHDLIYGHCRFVRK